MIQMVFCFLFLLTSQAAHADEDISGFFSGIKQTYMAAQVEQVENCDTCYANWQFVNPAGNQYVRVRAQGRSLEYTTSLLNGVWVKLSNHIDHTRPVTVSMARYKDSVRVALKVVRLDGIEVKASLMPYFGGARWRQKLGYGSAFSASKDPGPLNHHWLSSTMEPEAVRVEEGGMATIGHSRNWLTVR